MLRDTHLLLVRKLGQNLLLSFLEHLEMQQLPFVAVTTALYRRLLDASLHLKSDDDEIDGNLLI
jgi:hypothetical protein